MEQKLNSEQLQQQQRSRHESLRLDSSAAAFDMKSSNRRKMSFDLDDDFFEAGEFFKEPADNGEELLQQSKLECETEKAVPLSLNSKMNGNISPLTSKIQQQQPSSSSASDKSNGISVSNLPFEPLYVTANDTDISVILKNIKNVIYDENYEADKTAKVCNFRIRNKVLNDSVE